MLQMMAAAVAVGLVIAGCGDNIDPTAPPAPDAVVDAAQDPLFGAPCPIPSEPGVVYPCHYSAPDTPDGWCVQPPGAPAPVCRPMCRDAEGIFCKSIGGVIWQQADGNGACVCVPPPP